MRSPNGPSDPPMIRTIKLLLWPIEQMEFNVRKYGDIYSTRILGFPKVIVVSNPQALEEIFTASAGTFTCRNPFLGPVLGKYSLFSLNGEPHQRHRKLLAPPFHGERMRIYGDIIRDVTKEVISQWNPGQAFLVRPAMMDISLQVILRAVFGLQESDRFQRFHQALTALLNLLDSPLTSALFYLRFLQRPIGPWGNLLHKRQVVENLVLSEVQERRNLPDINTDILSLMLATRDEAGQPLSDIEITDELLTLLVAGYETTASALAWSLYWIHDTPHVFERLQQELISEQTLDPYETSRLPYLNAVSLEALRLYPVVMFATPRLAQIQVNVGGYTFDPGTVFTPCIYLTHHREDLYPEPKRFNPERFLERQFSPYEYLPFGGGNRRCIGAAFALFEMKIAVATVLRNCKLSLVKQKSVKPKLRGVTYSPPKDMNMVRIS
jgi:cytochrome P450 family 110